MAESVKLLDDLSATAPNEDSVDNTAIRRRCLVFERQHIQVRFDR